MVAELLASPAADLLTGANLPFVASFLMAVLFTLLSVFGLGQSESDADVDADADADLDHDVDLEHDVDLDHDVDLEHDVELEVDHDLEIDVGHDVDVGADHDVETGADFDHDLDVEHDVGIEHDAETDLAHDHDVEADAGHATAAAASSGVTLSDILYFFGIGKVPLSILLMTFGYTFGLTGWLVNTLVAGSGRDVSSWFGLSLIAALMIGLVAMRLVSSAIARVMPTKDVSGFRRRQLVGMRGEVGLPASEHSGRAQITDPEGTRHQVRCRVVPGGAELPKGTKIIVVKYVAEDDLYYVAADRRR